MNLDGRLYGLYRAEVIEVDIDDNEYGAIRVFIPDLHTDLDPDYDPQDKGLIAYPANNSIGGRNTDNEGSYGWGQVLIPRVGDWIVVYFERSLYRVYYLCALNIQNAKLPPENRLNYEGSILDEPHTVYTVIKTYRGRTFVVADSEDVQRMEITGKKRVSSPSSTSGGEDQEGNYFTIDGNQTTILFDEREGKEKILVRTYKGDYVHIDIDERQLQMYFKNDITIQTDGNLNIEVAKEIKVHSGDDINIESDTSIFEKAGLEFNNESGTSMNHKAGTMYNCESTMDMNHKTAMNYNAEAAQNMNHKTTMNMNLQSGAITNILAGGVIATDGEAKLDQCGAAGPAIPASPASPSLPESPILPEGERDT